MEETIKDTCNNCRSAVKAIEVTVRSMLTYSDFSEDQSYVNQHPEMKANIMLAVRHLEDARMRLGKVLQAQDGGISVYDK